MSKEIFTFHIECNRDNIPNAIAIAFNYIEFTDEMVGEICTNPRLMQQIVKGYIDEVQFDYIPEGIGMFRGAYLKFRPSKKENEITFITHSKAYQLKMELI